MYTLFNREPVQCWQNRANMVIIPGEDIAFSSIFDRKGRFEIGL